MTQIARRRWWCVATLTAVLALAAATAAAAGSGAGAAPSGTITLSGWASNPVETKLLREVLRGFQKTFPQIEVEYAPVSGDYPASMLARFSARTPPDVFYVDSNVIPDWIRQGVLEPLSPYVAQQKFATKPFFPRLLSAFTSEGRIYGFPKDWSPLAMQTNNRFLRTAGVRPPTTQAQLTAAATRLRGSMPSGARPICLSPSWDRLLAFVYQNGGSFVNLPAKRMTVNSPAVRNTVNWYVGLIRRGLAGTPAQLGVGWCGEALGKEKAAIIFEGNWVIPAMSADYPNVRYSINRMLSGTRGHGNLAFTVSYSMARDSDNKPAAWQLIRYLVSRPGMKTWTSRGLALPSRSDVPPVAGRQAFIADAPFARPWQFAPGFDKVRTTADNELAAVIEGKTSVADMLAKVEDEGNAALSR
jgi:multiple sugar transport system substrate-binding protein